MSEHTKGLWEVGTYGSNFAVYGGSREDKRICYVYGESTGCPPDEVKANARLIAAAPELLEALTAIVDSQETEDELWKQGAFEKARAAIFKAIGGQS